MLSRSPSWSGRHSRTPAALLRVHPGGDGRVYAATLKVTDSSGDVGAATANLRAPVVVNPIAGLGRQVVLADGAHPIRRPLRR